jgi:predicted RecA/RadA family phage recombinase
MATNAAYKGDVMPYTQTSGSTVDANTVVAIATAALGQVTAGATVIGIALDDLLSGVEGSLAVEGVWSVTKNTTSDTFAQGAQIGITSGKAVAASTSNLAVNARVYKASGATDTTVLVKLF